MKFIEQTMEVREEETVRRGALAKRKVHDLSASDDDELEANDDENGRRKIKKVSEEELLVIKGGVDEAFNFQGELHELVEANKEELKQDFGNKIESLVKRN